MNTNIPETEQKRIVIVGGGFGGLKLIDKLKNTDFQLVLVDKNNYHQFPPLFYQVGTAGLEANSILFPFRKMFQKYKNFCFRLAEVKSIDEANHTIQTSIGDIRYDYLVLAAGATTNFYGNKEVQEKSLPMKSTAEALELRNKIISNLERATTSTDPDERQALMNIVVVGGGATGVEVAGALAEMKRFIIPKDYPELNPKELNIYLVEGSPKVLGGMSPESSGHAQKDLEKMGVTLMLNSLVTGYDGTTATLKDGKTIKTKTFIWVSGVMAVTFDNIPKEQMGHAGRLLVNEYSQVQGTQNVFAIGDISLMMTEEKYPKGHPQVAQAAIQQGKLLAENFLRMEKGKRLEAFQYKDLGTLATIGRSKAVADIHKFQMHGFTAWMVWLLVHLRSILGVKNKVTVLIDWLWNYSKYDQSERYIMYVPNTHMEKEETLPEERLPEGQKELIKSNLELVEQ